MSDSPKTQNKIRAEMIAVVKPERPFDPDKIPPPLDYSSTDSWAAWPGRRDNADLVPVNTDCVNSQDTALADVFFIHPTTYLGKGNWNQPADNLRAIEGVSEMVLPGQAGVFNGCARVYAPWYRQATIYSVVDTEGNGQQAFELAYEDVVRAFRFFLEHINKDRPFIIAGHSQGSIHGIRLLEEEVDTKPCRERLIAAYLGGGLIPMDKFDRALTNLVPSDRPDDTGTVIGWDTVYVGYEDKQDLDGIGHWYPGGWESNVGKPRLATNLLDWSRSEKTADPNLYLGVLDLGLGLGKLDMFRYIQDEPMGVKCTQLRIIDTERVSAQNRNGFLCVQEVGGDLIGKRADYAGSLHNSNFDLFYMNIRRNAELRVETFLNR